MNSCVPEGLDVPVPVVNPIHVVLNIIKVLPWMKYVVPCCSYVYNTVMHLHTSFP
jgi:hypothetical protein